MPTPFDRPLERAFSRGSDPIFVLDPGRDRIRYANHCACRLVGYDVDELLEIPIRALVHGEGSELEAFLGAIETQGHGWTSSLTLRTRAGSFLPAELLGLRVVGDDRPGILVLARDRSRHRQRPRTPVHRRPPA